MPGGKGLTAPFDITEIYGADVLYESEGIILESERNTAKLFGAAHTCYSCGGSTLAVQAMLAAVREDGGRKIAAGRYSHRSLISSAVLLGLDIDWIYPDSFLSCRITSELAESVIDKDTSALFVNAVDYYGGRSDIKALSRVCKSHGIPLLADNAHGAYLVFTENHPVRNGADMCADSAHKTLPALTGTAYLHLSDDRYYSSVKASMALFGSSSPSYLLLDSLDLCSRFIAENKAAAIDKLRKISVLKEKLLESGFSLRDSDPLRITLDAASVGYSGHELAASLRENYIECEMCDADYVVLLFSVVQPDKDFDIILSVLNRLKKRPPKPRQTVSVIRPEYVLSPREAYFSASETVPIKQSPGRICSGILCPCPPCVPVVMPGERIDSDIADVLSSFGIDNIKVCSQYKS